MKRNKVIVVGCGRLGASIATKLSEMGEDVHILDVNEDAFRKLRETFSGFEMVGDATDLSVLENAQIKQAKSVVVTTNNDNTNIFIAHVAYYVFNVPRIVVRLADTDKGELLVGTRITPIYPFTLSLNQYLSMNGGGEDR
ncbi:MAG: NAD-binding protein [Acholeplasmataceae bacterium]|nr:NAD-binding protein [Acholeplasmataceae bacterium]